MKSSLLLYIELLTLFVLLPLSFLWNYPIYLKIVVVLTGFIYILITLKKASALRLNKPGSVISNAFIERISIQFVLLIVAGTIYVYLEAPNKLFAVPLKKPGLWVLILAVYTFLSVWPQEIIYRTFFFLRYEQLLPNKWVLILVNGVLFSLAHIFFRNTLVLLLTFIGGLCFAYTYFITRSTLLVSVEHAIYGNWLFTVGMGEMLAFPGVE